MVLGDHDEGVSHRTSSSVPTLQRVCTDFLCVASCFGFERQLAFILFYSHDVESWDKVEGWFEKVWSQAAGASKLVSGVAREGQGCKFVREILGPLRLKQKLTLVGT